MEFILSAVVTALALIAKDVASEATKDAYRSLKALLQRKLAGKPEANRALDTYEKNPEAGEAPLKAALVEARLDQDEEVVQQAQQLATFAPVLKRAQRVASVLKGAQLLWVDNNPENNLYEREMLRALGISVALARSTSEGLAMLARTKYDVVISDMERDGIPDEGLRFLTEMRTRGLFRRTIFYIGVVDWERGTPPYAFGITNRPDDLLHYVLDVLERERS
jgi:CheY-like chemotaxis protein